MNAYANAVTVSRPRLTATARMPARDLTIERGSPRQSPATAVRHSSGCSSSTQETGASSFVCPICFNSRKLDESELVANAKLAGATPLWEWIGDGATVFSY
jgi:hypothetical protein